MEAEYLNSHLNVNRAEFDNKRFRWHQFTCTFRSKVILNLKMQKLLAIT